MPISIIIPAHNESAVIARTLHSLLDDAHPGELEVIVVVNGCSDDTADRVRALNHPDVRMIETDIGSKIHALNLGDLAATSFPRFYIDADVLVPVSAIRSLSKELVSARTLAIAPHYSMDLSGCSWAVRAFYNINCRMPTSREGIGGSGVYGLSAEGRARFHEFPAVTADDGFVRCLFKPEERRTLSECSSTVFAPRTLPNLIKIKTRSHFGSYELRRLFPDLWANRGPRNGAALKRLAANPLLWPDVAIYVYVKVLARCRARKRQRLKQSDFWERDDSSRLRLPAS